MQNVSIFLLALGLSLPHQAQADNHNFILGGIVAGVTVLIGGLTYFTVKEVRKNFVKRTLQDIQSALPETEVLYQRYSPFMQDNEESLEKCARSIHQDSTFKKRFAYIKNLQKNIQRLQHDLAAIKESETTENIVELKIVIEEKLQQLATMLRFFAKHEAYFTIYQLIHEFELTYRQELTTTDDQHLIKTAIRKGLQRAAYPMGIINYAQTLQQDTELVEKATISSALYPTLAARFEQFSKRFFTMSDTIIASEQMLTARRAYQDHIAQQQRLAIEQEKAEAARRQAQAQEEANRIQLLQSLQEKQIHVSIYK